MRLALAGVLLAASGPAAAAGKIRVLLLSGQNNHNWKQTTPALVEIFRRSGRFEVKVVEDPSKLTAGSFAACDVVVSNWTPWPNINRRVWEKATEEAFLRFIRAGGGLVVFHAASTAMQNWEPFQQIVGATWAMGRTGHGRRHEFEVKIADPSHPVTAGLKPFRIFDELWHRMGVQKGAKVLCTAFSSKANRGTGQDEPVAFATQFGRGRGFNLVLGHDVKAMSAPGWQALMLRGTEWAATGKVTLPAPGGGSGAAAEAPPGAAAGPAGGDGGPAARLKAVYGYRFGDNRAPLMALERKFLTAAADPAGRKRIAAALAASLAAKATADYRKFACRLLGLVGTDAEVPALAALLGDEKLSLAARSALQRMGGKAALAAMRKALPAADGALKIGLIDSLGERRDPEAVGPIAAALSGKDPAVVAAAVDALGKIATPEAVDALLAAAPKLAPGSGGRLADALLRCAERLLAAGDRKAAAAIYEHLSVPGQPRHVRMAAFPGLVASRGEKATETLLAALRGADVELQQAAVRAVRAVGADAAVLGAVADALPKLAAPVQAMVLEVLGERRVAAALPAVRKAAESPEPLVRQAAVSALGRLGDASAVPVLARRAAEGEGAERQLARAALRRLRGAEAAMVAALKSARPGERAELLAALGERGAVSAVEAMLTAARDADDSVRLEAVKALGKVAPISACPDMVLLLMRAKTEADRAALESALLAVCRRGGAAEGVERLLAAADRGNPALMASLLSVMGRLGGPKALREVLAAAESANGQLRAAALRALGEWPDAGPLEKCLALAQKAPDDVARVLALRALARLASRAKDRNPDELADLYARALAVARGADVKRLLLGGLGGVRSVKALAAAEVLMRREPTLAGEAAAAVVKIADLLWVSRPKLVEPVLQRLLKASVPQPVAAEARRILLELSRPPNLARDAKATSPDGLDADGQASGDQAAIDGKPETYWDEVNGRRLYRLVVTFPEPRTVGALRILGFQHHNYAPKDFQVLCDGKVVAAVRDAQYRDNRLTVPLPPSHCTTVELKITGYYGASPAIRELEIYPPQSPAAPGAGAEGRTGAGPATEARPAPRRMAGQPKLTWKRSGESLGLLNHGRVVWRFDPAKEGNGKAYFHPLGLLDGSTLTWFRPPDHPWHRALWFCWTGINGVNYWEENRTSGVSPGITEVREVKVLPAPDHSARMELALAYHPPGKPDVLAEKRSIRVTAPDAEGCYRIDLAMDFRPCGGEVVLKGGRSGGGYAGLSARLAAETRRWRVLNSEGLADEKAHGRRARWVAWSGQTASGRPGCIAIFDHPANPRHPTYWYVAARRKIPFHYFSPALLFKETYTIPTGGKLSLRYRVLVRAGLADAAALNAEFQAFAKSK